MRVALIPGGYVEHSEGFQGVEPFRQQVAALRAVSPDLRVTIEDVLTDGDRFVSRTTVTGTQTGDLMDMPATGSASGSRPSTSAASTTARPPSAGAARTCTPC
ncbi:MAG TPA: ester cyclase [Streptosporangiaceae bacterium]|nr:ester cyclase [Streptosporangiaceae bacterium]